MNSLWTIWGLSSTSWIVLWSVMALCTVLLLILLRTRWSRARPWWKCAVLSLWVHVLLACAATTVRIVTGAPEPGHGEPIRVTVLPLSQQQVERLLEEEITPPAEPLTDSPVIGSAPVEAPAWEPLEAPPLEPLAAPELSSALAESQQEPLPSPAPSELAEGEQNAAESSEEAAATAEATEVVEQIPASEPSAPAAARVPETRVPETYTDRFAPDRLEVAQESGGSVQTERAVRAALGWLVQAQSAHGGWDASQFGAGEERVILGHDRQGAGVRADTGVSGLALLALLGAGQTHLQGAYAPEVARGLEYFRRVQRSDGSLYGEAQLFARMYCHSMATFGVCEAYALTGDQRLEPLARAAVRYTLAMQHPSDGGWRYRRGDTGDTSQLGWQLMTLKSAELAGLQIPPVTWTRVERFLRRVRRGQAGGLAAYRPVGPPSRTMTAEALFCRRLLGHDAAEGAALSEALHSITERLPTADAQNLYFWYYASLALHQHRQLTPAAAAAWEDWNQALTTALLTTQQRDGSWSADTLWGGYGGRVYTTALAALCLEVYYRYSPAEEAAELAKKKGWQSVQR